MLLDFDEIVKKYNMTIKGVIHIGAHHGQEHIIYKKNGIKNIVYFEPLSKNFKVLKENIGEDATLFNLALGNKEDYVEMFVERNNKGQSSSVLEPKLHLIQYPHITFDEKETVKMTKLDNIELDLNKYNFINIDVQGYELEVFKGAIKTLENVDYIISEINRDELYKGCVKIEELSKFLSNFGFIPVEQSWIGRTWGDGLFIKNK
jgi:FkbM family methyltransferase